MDGYSYYLIGAGLSGLLTAAAAYAYVQSQNTGGTSASTQIAVSGSTYAMLGLMVAVAAGVSFYAANMWA